MIKLLIVDDEQEIREGIRYSADWEENGIQVVGEASNGVEALEVISKTCPDILIVDIRMPEMNGLQLLEALSNSQPYIKSIILSGYEDFDYARKSLQLGASNYLLKPCRPKDLLESVLKVKAQIENENKRMKALQKDYSEFLPIIKNKLLSNMITGRIMDLSTDKLLDYFKLKISLKNLRVVLFRLDTSINVSTGNIVEAIKSDLIKALIELVDNEYPCEVFEENEDIVLLINLEEYSEIPLKLFNNIKANIKRELNITFSIGISNYCSSYTKLNTAYKEALEALDFKFFFGDATIINYNDIKGMYNYNNSYPIDKETHVLNCIKAGDEKSLAAKIDSFLEFNTGFESNKGFIIKSSLALLFSIYHLCIDNNVPGNEILEHINTSDKLYGFQSINQLKEYLLDVSTEILHLINNNKKSGNKLVENLIKYVNENYNKDINLETVAKSSFISPTYVSILFKQVLKINFVDYLHKVRLNKACELLRDPKLRSYQIAYMVGYNDEKYFSQIFKKSFGLTPTQYRENLI